jgi:hypothetical protein
MRNIAIENKFHGKVMRIMRNAVKKVTALLRVFCAVPEPSAFYSCAHC